MRTVKSNTVGRRFAVAVATAAGAVVLSASPAAAYPPDDTAPQESVGGVGGGGEIPRTGSDSSDALRIAGVATVAGAALVGVAAARRRRPA